jgi:hypothetical protein
MGISYGSVTNPTGQQPNAGGYDEDWRKLLGLGLNTNSNNSTELNRNYGPWTENLTSSLLSSYTKPSFDSTFNRSATIDPDIFNIRTSGATRDYDSTKDKGGLFGKGWVTNENLGGFSNAMSGISSAMDAINNWRTLKMTQDNYARAWDLSDKNLANQVTTTNNMIRGDNNWRRVMNNSEGLSQYVTT